MTPLFIKREACAIDGKYVMETNPWGIYDSKPPLDDYDCSVVGYDAGSMAVCQMQWRFPEPVRGKPWAYPYVSKGQYWIHKPPVPQAAFTLGKLTYFDFAFIASVMGEANVLAEFFPTKVPGDIGTRTAEIGWLMNMPDLTLAWFKSCKLVGAYTSRGSQKWEVRVDPNGGSGVPYYMIAPADYKPAMSLAAVEALAGVRYLLAQKAAGVDPSYYINGFALGAEPLGGAGSLNVSKFQVALQG